MSTAELLVIFLVSLVVFGPKKLPMLAKHLAIALRYMSQWQQQLQDLWQSELNKQQLKENEKQAELADKQYTAEKEKV